VVLLDRRVVTKRYGPMMLEGLPPASKAIGNWPDIRRELEEFFAMHGIGAPVSWS
jgi:Rad3-related DNA helicase